MPPSRFSINVDTIYLDEDGVACVSMQYRSPCLSDEDLFEVTGEVEDPE